MQGNYFEPAIECASREVMHYIQSQRLVSMVKRCYENVPLYKQRMDEKGLLPGDIKSIDDITKLPFTFKSDLRDHYPFGPVSYTHLIRDYPGTAKIVEIACNTGINAVQ